MVGCSIQHLYAVLHGEVTAGNRREHLPGLLVAVPVVSLLGQFLERDLLRVAGELGEVGAVRECRLPLDPVVAAVGGVQVVGVEKVPVLAVDRTPMRGLAPKLRAK